MKIKHDLTPCKGKKPPNLLELLVHGQSNLWGDIDEPFTEDEPHRLCAVVQEFTQLLQHWLLTALLTATQQQLLDLLSTLRALQAKGAFSSPDTATAYTRKPWMSAQGNFLQACWQFPSAASKALHNGSEILLQP